MLKKDALTQNSRIPIVALGDAEKFFMRWPLI